MREIHDDAEVIIEGDPRMIFETITDIERLPEWNGAIEQVIDGPAGLTTGCTWTVEMHPARPMRWKSVSTLQELDAEGLRFTYRTVNADGNPSHTLWCWKLTPTSAGVQVSVHWDVYLKSLDRRLFAGPIRRRQLRKEVAASLVMLAALVGSSSDQTPPTRGE
jgi:uncharacterized protein YndB with AHSA1/START domain